MTAISFKGASAQDKINLLGREFANIEVVDMDFFEGMQITRIVFDGLSVTLVGDPQLALLVMLGGTPSSLQTRH
jgi:hypothetical protein